MFFIRASAATPKITAQRSGTSALPSHSHVYEKPFQHRAGINLIAIIPGSSPDEWPGWMAVVKGSSSLPVPNH